MSSAIFPKSIPKAPELVPVAFLNLQVEDPENILKNGSYSSVVNLVNIVGGSISTVPNKLNLELDATVVKGSDHITANTEASVNRLDCKVYGKTANGSGLFIHYPGVIKASESIGKILSGAEGATGFEDDYISNNPVFSFSESVEDKYLWALRENIVGKGRFIRGDDKKLFVQYYLYVLHV